MHTALLDGLAVTTSHRDRDDLDCEVAGLVMQFLEASAVTMLRVVREDGSWRVVRQVAVSNVGGELVSVSSEESADAVALSPAPEWQECIDRREIVRCAAANGFPMILFPIQGPREIVGILQVDAAKPLSSREADLVCGILRIVKNHLALLDYGEVDTLTGLLNRKTFESMFAKLHQRLTRTGKGAGGRHPSWLGLMDIDKFKLINDSHGHLFGDEVLLLVSQIMKRTFRAGDRLFRFGGEEFVIVIDCAQEAGAQLAFERLRTTIEAYSFPQVGRVTISLGCTRIELHDTPISCVERADAALYYAKDHGRNNVQNHETLVATGELSATCKSGEIELF
jgi:diguanylate cyclase (GGDEF)-like protein